MSSPVFAYISEKKALRREGLLSREWMIPGTGDDQNAEPKITPQFTLNPLYGIKRKPISGLRKVLA
jgi:hypothetical protein